MDVLKYLKSIESLPDRFSNLAFWRCLRTFRDTIVDVFTYINMWGNTIEQYIDSHVYDSKSNRWELTYVSQTFIGTRYGDMYHFVPEISLYEIDVIPHFIQIEGAYEFYTSSARDTTASSSVAIPFRVVNYNSLTRVGIDPLTIYAPHGIKDDRIIVTLYYNKHI